MKDEGARHVEIMGEERDICNFDRKTRRKETI
jgi:hypothetical protein